MSYIDRLIHHSEIVNIEADSLRFKEAKEKSESRIANRRKPKKLTTATNQEDHYEHTANKTCCRESIDKYATPNLRAFMPPLTEA